MKPAGINCVLPNEHCEDLYAIPSILHVSIIYATYEKCAFVKGVCILFSEPAGKARLRSSMSPIASIAVRGKKTVTRLDPRHLTHTKIAEVTWLHIPVL